MKQFIVISFVALVAVVNAQVSWYQNSLECGVHPARLNSLVYTFFDSTTKVLYELRSNGKYYVNTAACDSLDGCKTDLEVTKTCTKIGTTDNHVAYDEANGYLLIGAGSGASVTCDDKILAMSSNIVNDGLKKCAIITRTAVADSKDVSYSAAVGDEACASPGSSIAIPATDVCTVLGGFGSVKLSDKYALTLYPGDLACSTSESSGKYSFPTDATCYEYATGVFGKFTLGDDEKALFVSGCTDKDCSVGCTESTLEKAVCVLLAPGSVIYGSTGLSGGAIAGIVIGVILGIALIAGIIVVFVKKSSGSSGSAV